MKKRARGNGFNLVVLAMAITVLNILLAMALPSWSTYIQREREEELIFRGLQYAEAIRIFQLRHNRFPTQLRELIEVYPRSIRQLWRNPVVEDGSWLLLPIQAQAGQPLQREQQGQGQQDGSPAPPPNPNAGRPVQRPGAGPALTAVRVVPPKPGELQFTPQPSVPFMGVASPEGETAIKTFMGSNEITDWHFTAELVSSILFNPHNNIGRPVNSGIFWRPFPPGVSPGLGDPALRPQPPRRQPQ